MLKVVIVGYGEMFTNLIAGTLDANCEIKGVLRKDTVKYPSFIKKLRDIFNPSLEYSYIKSLKIPEINARSVNSKEFSKALLKLSPDILLVGSWGEKIKKEIYDIPKIASINAHPSLLPKYRGPNPYFWTIRNRELSSGVSFHLIDGGYDTGAIIAQEEIKIYPHDTGKSLKERTVLTARAVVSELLSVLSEDLIIPLTQNEEKACYYSYPDNLRLDFSSSAEDNYALIRAIYPWNKTWFYYNDTCLEVNHQGSEILENNTTYKNSGTITAVDYKKSAISVLCADNKILKLKVNLYPKYKAVFTSAYIKRNIREGQRII